MSTAQLKVSPKTKDILSYESIIFSTADTLRGNVTTKEAMWPGFMMPFFALMMIESRLIRAYDDACKDPSLKTDEARIRDVQYEYGSRFYNAEIIEKKLTLEKIVQDSLHWEKNFSDYLNGFNADVRKLLGVSNGKDENNLNIEGRIRSLSDAGVLLGWLGKWATIDFTPYNNSEITTLEEHIKRKWADMSAETAGQQYTPSDIIRLISMLAQKTKRPSNGVIKIYDMTCGGGNMLYGVEDALRQVYDKPIIHTFGQEMEGSLYSLAKIESMFRDNSRIERGNTLTEDKLADETMTLVVANPPYGVDWKDVKDKVEADQTHRFEAGKPSTSDGQLLFVQHAISKLDEDCGTGFIVLNGSPLFSGDAGGGESNIRKWILENDYLEALIQLPTNEFFNTGITTYIWCLNMNKPADRKNKILCINAENEFVKLKKSKGDKSNEISPEQAKKIVDLYDAFQNSNISVVKSKYDFYYNRQAIKRLEKDEVFGALKLEVDSDGRPQAKKLTDIHTIIFGQRENEGRVGFTRITTSVDLPSKEEAVRLNALLKGIDNDEQQLSVFGESVSYRLDSNHCIIKTEDGKEENLGYGDISIKAVYKKATKTEAEKIAFDIQLEQVWTKDEERVAYSPNKDENAQSIRDFMCKWVSSDEGEYVLIPEGNVIGVEINFNSVFPKKIEIRNTKSILADLKALDKEFGEI